MEHGFDRLWEWSRQDDRTEAVAPANAATSPAFELEDRRGADVRVEHVLWTVRECPEVDLHREKLIAQETGSEYTFVFAANSLTRNKQSEVRKVLEQVRGAESLEVAITDGHNHALVLSATFPLAGSKPAIEALLKGI